MRCAVTPHSAIFPALHPISMEVAVHVLADHLLECKWVLFLECLKPMAAMEDNPPQHWSRYCCWLPCWTLEPRSSLLAKCPSTR